MKSAIYAGSFDPLTFGHLDVIRRASRLYDHLIVAVARNTSKTSLFSSEEKLEIVRQCTGDLPNVSAEHFDGLLVDHAKRKEIGSLVRGIRTVSDFEYEFRMALTNRQLAPGIETVFLMTDGAFAHVSSSLIKEIVRMGGDVSGMVPVPVRDALQKKVKS